MRRYLKSRVRSQHYGILVGRDKINTADKSKMIVVGRLGRPHGIQGWMRLISFTEPAENILDYSQWFIENAADWTLIPLVETKLQSGLIYLKLPHCDTPEQARLYTNKSIAITREQLPTLSADDFYWTDLEGLKVINHQGIELGILDHLFATGSNDVMVVIGEQERLIPYIKTVVSEVNLAEKYIRVDWDQDF